MTTPDARSEQSAGSPPKSPTAATADDKNDSAWLDADGRERPRFLKNFPEDELLKPLVQAFEAGDYDYVRREAERVSEQTQSPEVKRAARELRRRIDPDPLVQLLFGLALALFTFLVIWSYLAQD